MDLKKRLAPHEAKAAIYDCLASRHCDDLYALEVSLSGQGSRRIDVWAMKRSWANAAVHGYEVKVSRSDWVNDQKFTEYLPCCTHLWVVAPAGVVQVEELPDGVGYMQLASTGSRLFQKRKAPRREMDWGHPVFRSLLINRVRRFSDARLYSPEDGVAFWRQWLQEREDGRAIGYRVSKSVRDYVDEIKTESQRIKNREAPLGRVVEMLKELGIDEAWRPDEKLKALYEGQKKRMTAKALRSLKAMAFKLNQTIQDVEGEI